METEHGKLEVGSIKIIYEIVMMLLALMVAVILYIDFTKELSSQQSAVLHSLDLGILIIFAGDYFSRLYKADNKSTFFKQNLLDLIAIIPFDMTFRAARLARLVRIGRLLRTLRVVALLQKRFPATLGILRTNDLGRVLMVSSLLILAGAISIFFLEPNMTTFEDALWWSFVTTTTVGYGDISPVSTGGRLTAIILMLIGIGTIGMLTGAIATFFLGGGSSEKDDIKELIYKKIDNLEELSNQEYKELLKLIELKKRSKISKYY